MPTRPLVTHIEAVPNVRTVKFQIDRQPPKAEYPSKTAEAQRLYREQNRPARNWSTERKSGSGRIAGPTYRAQIAREILQNSKLDLEPRQHHATKRHNRRRNKNGTIADQPKAAGTRKRTE